MSSRELHDFLRESTDSGPSCATAHSAGDVGSSVPALQRLRAGLIHAMGLAPSLALAAALGACVGGDKGAVDDEDEVPWGGDDTGELARVCGDVTELEEAVEAGSVGEGEVLVCIDLPSDGADCPPWPEDALREQLWEVAGAPATDCVWHPDKVCGPETGIQDACCYVADILVECWSEGRPFTVDGEARTACLVDGSSWSSAMGTLPTLTDVQLRAAEGWAEAALAEHASVASFGRFVLELMAVGAPPELVAGATRAMADEIAHARLAFGVVERLSGQARGPGALPLAGALPEHVTLRDVVMGTLAEGCVNETLAAAEARAAASVCQDPQICPVLERIAVDEAEHSALAWRFLRWALCQDPSLIAEVGAWLTAHGAPTINKADPDPALAAFGRLDGPTRAGLAESVWSHVILPAWDALRHDLLAEVRDGASAA